MSRIWDKTFEYDSNGNWIDINMEEKKVVITDLLKSLNGVFDKKNKTDGKCKCCYSYTLSKFKKGVLCTTCGYSPDINKDIKKYKKNWLNGKLFFQDVNLTFIDWYNEKGKFIDKN